MTGEVADCDICIVGGGPAGMILGLLLAKRGVRVLVLEQHRDFAREYRGEVLMPRFTQRMQQIGLFDDLEKCRHLKLEGIEGYYKNHRLLHLSLRDVAPEAPFAIWMPQPILLNFLYEKAKQFPNFQMEFDAGAQSLIEENGAVRGVIVHNEHGEKKEVRAKITVGADGRFSVVRRLGGFELEYEDYHFDLVWFSIPKPPEYDNQVRFFLSPARNYLILPKYPDLLQCGLVASRGEYAQWRHEGIESLRHILLQAHTMLHPFAKQIRDFSPFNVLQARIEFVRRWARDGVLLVGDSAHTCSPAGAIGVAVAVESAIVAADVISDALQTGDVSAARLDKLQQLREREVREIHRLQKNFTRFLVADSPTARFFLPLLVWLAAKTGILKIFQRKMVVVVK